MKLYIGSEIILNLFPQLVMATNNSNNNRPGRELISNSNGCPGGRYDSFLRMAWKT